MLRLNLVCSCSLLLFGGFLSEYQVENLVASSHAFSVSTHREVPLPPQIKTSNPELLVGLKPYLGRSVEIGSNPEDLVLISAGIPLELQDASGIKHKAREIEIGWRMKFLSEPYHIERQVIGPFSSFESAKSMANDLQEYGLQVVISHPKEWEIWLPRNSDLPLGIKSSLFKKTIKYELKPVLKGMTGEFLLSGPIEIEAPEGLRLDGGIYSGPFILQADGYGTWTLIEKVPLERYLNGVVPYEIGSGSPPAALAVQAVLARTWALANTHRFEVDGYHLCSNTQCQVYKDPMSANLSVRKAISQTKGKILLWRERPISAVYHASNGGVMAVAEEAWSMSSLPYLQAKLDGNPTFTEKFVLPLNRPEVASLLASSTGFNGTNHSLFRWTRSFTAFQFKEILKLINPDMTLPQRITVLKRGESGRVIALEIAGRNNQPVMVLRLDEIRRTIRNLPSTLFIVNSSGEGIWEFLGGGFGHGAGLSQAGAIDLALQGWSSEQILMHYYPGTTYGPLPEFKNAL